MPGWLPGFDPSLCESETPEGVLERLKAKNLAVILNDQWALVRDSTTLSDVKRIIVEPQLAAPTLTKDQQARLLSVLMEQSRFVPVVFDTRREADKSLTALISLRYQVHVLPSQMPGMLSLVVLLRQFNSSGYNRLAFAEWHDGEFAVKWDSGQLDAVSVGVEFDDIEGNGEQEIVAMGERFVDFDAPKDDVLAVFDVEGNELTRQKNCPGNGFYPERAEVMVCPIEGADVSFITGKTPWEIDVSDGEDPSNAKTTTYRLVAAKKRYVAVGSPDAKSPQKKSKQ